jgi:hypothetical protein
MLWFVLSLVPALAQDIDDLDDDIDIGESSEPTSPKPTPPPQPDDPILPDAEDDAGLEDFRDVDDDEDLLGDEPQGPTSGDTEQVYRAAMNKLSALEPDEELAGWEAYLGLYPNSVYRTRIENRMEELTDKMYEVGIGGPKQEVDALKAEIGFAQGLQIENIDPRTRLQVGFEMGLPNYVNLVADYERQLMRNFSFHAGLKRRYTGYNGEVGVHWALVKSVRTKMLVTLIGDVRFNTIPFYPGLRPQLAVGKRFGRLDAQLQAGADLTYRTWTDPFGDAASAVQPAIVGGASLFYAANDQVGAFVESNTYMKELAADGAFEGGLFRFNVVTFGLKFFPTSKGSPSRDKEVNFGATVPYMQQWWQFHYGSIMGQFNYYPEL